MCVCKKKRLVAQENTSTQTEGARWTGRDVAQRKRKQQTSLNVSSLRNIRCCSGNHFKSGVFSFSSQKHVSVTGPRVSSNLNDSDLREHTAVESAGQLVS